MRGGKAISIEGVNVKQEKTTGLEASYAFQYSLGKAETAVVLMPDAFGGSSAKPLGENSKVIEKLTDKGIPEEQAMQVANSLPRYWGGIDGVGTSGPPYIGAVICLLAWIGFAIVRHAAALGIACRDGVGILMAWGQS